MQEQSRVIASMSDGEQKRQAEADFSVNQKNRLQAKADAAFNRAAALAAFEEHAAEILAATEGTAVSDAISAVDMPLLLKTKTSDEIGSSSTNRRDR